MPPSVTLTLVDGVRIVVPDSLNLITPYVLMEQHVNNCMVAVIDERDRVVYRKRLANDLRQIAEALAMPRTATSISPGRLWRRRRSRFVSAHRPSGSTTERRQRP